MTIKKSDIIVNLLAITGVAATAYYLGSHNIQTSSDAIKAPITEAIKLNPQISESPIAKDRVTWPTFNLGSFTGRKFWEGDVLSEEVRFKIKLTKDQLLSINGTPIYTIDLLAPTGENASCQTSDIDCSKFKVPVSGEYQIIIYYKQSMGYDEQGNLTKPDAIRSTIQFSVE